MQGFFHQGVCSAAPGKVLSLLPHFIGKMNQTRTGATCLVTQQVWEQKPSCFLAHCCMDWTNMADSIYLLDKPKPQEFCVKRDYWASQPTLLHHRCSCSPFCAILEIHVHIRDAWFQGRKKSQLEICEISQDKHDVRWHPRGNEGQL